MHVRAREEGVHACVHGRVRMRARARARAHVSIQAPVQYAPRAHVLVCCGKAHEDAVDLMRIADVRMRVTRREANGVLRCQRVATHDRGQGCDRAGG